MPAHQLPAVSSDTPLFTSIPQLKVVFCGSVCEAAPRYTSSLHVSCLLAKDMQQLDREAFYVLHLNGKNQIIAKELISLGSLSTCIVHPREVFKGALLNNSAAIIGVHNHPSGDPAPSYEDRVITQRLRECADLLGVQFLDHIIVSYAVPDSRYFSFLDNGLLSRNHTHGVSVSVDRPIRTKCQWLIDLRKQAGITQKHLAALSGLKHQAVISEMERGDREIDEATEKLLRETLNAVTPQPC